MNNSNFRGILGQLGAQPQPRGRKDPDRSFYTYGAAPRNNSPTGALPLPGPGVVHPPNYVSGAMPGGAGMLRRAAGGFASDPGASGGTDGEPAAGGIQGPGSGREDLIDAKLSDGEWVADAETVALLGDGSTEEGIRRLEEMRRNLRSHKGQALAKGKFSPDAKTPEQYLGKE